MIKLTKEQVQARVTHPDWPECLEDLSSLWHSFIELGEYDEWDFRIKDLERGWICKDKMERLARIDARIRKMNNRFIRTFFPEIP